MNEFTPISCDVFIVEILIKLTDFILPILYKNVIFTCCNIRVLNQLDCLNEWKKLDSLTINKDDNPIYSISIWRQYAINRLSNLQLKKINNQMVTLDDLNSSNRLFSTISNWALDLPEYKLLSILGQEKYGKINDFIYFGSF